MAVQTEVGVLLTLCKAEFQQLNFDRIFGVLEDRGIFPKGITNVMKLKAAYEKCNVAMNFLQAQEDEVFKEFLAVVMAEDDPFFVTPSCEFLSMVQTFPGYEKTRGILDKDISQAQPPPVEVAPLSQFDELAQHPKSKLLIV